jgi:hypothetical protein
MIVVKVFEVLMDEFQLQAILVAHQTTTVL